MGRYVAEQLVARGDAVRVLVRRDVPELVAWAWKSFAAMSATGQASTGCARRSTSCIHVAGVAGIWGPWQHYYATNTSARRMSSPLAGGKRSADWFTLPAPASRSTASRSAASTNRVVMSKSGSAIIRIPRPWPSNGLGRQWSRAGHLCLAAAFDLGSARPSFRPAPVGASARAGCGGSATATNLIDMIYVENAAAAHLLAADALATGSGLRPSLLPQSRRTGQLLGLDRRAAGFGPACPPCGGRSVFAPLGGSGPRPKRSIVRCD